MMSLQTWIQKIFGWVTFVVCVLFFPFAVIISLVTSIIRSVIPTKYRVVKDKVVIVTGASSGIGQGIALEYAKRGARLVLAARRKEKLEEVQRACLENGAADAAICPTDISNAEACEHLVQFTVDTFGKGKSTTHLLSDLQDVDFWGNVLTTRSALEHLRRTKGQVVVTCSVAAFVPYPKQTAYNGQIPRWWPMMESADCAKKIVEAAMANRRWAVIPFWYTFIVFFRLFAPAILEILPRMFLLGKPPSKGVKTMCDSLLGEDTSRTAFQSLKAFAA